MATAIQHEHGMAAPEDALLSATILGQDLPPAAEWHLREAARAYRDDAIAEAHLLKAQALAPEHAAVLIGLYRFYFYKNRLPEALKVAHLCLARAAHGNALALDWREVQRQDADFSDWGAVLPRFYLFTLKAYAYLSMRLGDLAEGRAAAMKLLELDPSDKVGAKVLLGVLDRMEADDDG
jgi:tetratricopeptide (TPR) repeat protein